MRVECDGECVYEGRLFSAVIGNGVYRGGGVRQNEDGGCWSDGVLELSVMGGVSHVRAFFLMIHALKGDFPQQKGIVSRRFRRLVLTPLGGAPDRVESDGEIPGTLPLTVEYTGQQINIIVP